MHIRQPIDKYWNHGSFIHVLLVCFISGVSSNESCVLQTAATARSNLLQIDIQSGGAKKQNHLAAANRDVKDTVSTNTKEVDPAFPEVTTSIRYQGEELPVPNPRAALYSTLVRPLGKQHWKGNDMLLDTLFLYCSARWAGSQLPFHITTSGIGAENIRLLKDLGFHVHDFTALEEQVKTEWYKPVYTKEQAREQGRLWIDPVEVTRYGLDAEHALNRSDGWATYFKFLAWNNTNFDALLHVDVDVQFLGNPDAFIRGAAQQGDVFLATLEQGGRQYTGLNTHIMFLRPSPSVFDALVRKASQGDYVPLTNTEQDVLEWYFDKGAFTRQELLDGALHTHNDETAAAWKSWLTTADTPSQCTATSLAEADFGTSGLTCQRLADACEMDDKKRRIDMHVSPLSPRNCPARSAPYATSRRPRVFVIVPGFGEVARQQQLQTNMAWLRKQDVDIECVIYTYASEEKLPLRQDDFSPCVIKRETGYPAEFMLMPTDEDLSKHDYVLMWFDDVDIHPDTDLTRLVKILDHNGLGMLAPSFSDEMLRPENWPERHGSIMFHNASSQLSVGRHTSYAELLFSLMTPDSFRCLRGLIDVRVNPFGYGLDRLFPDRCSDYCLGVLDETTMLDTSQGSFSYEAAEDYQDAYFSKHGFPSDRQIVFGSLQDPYINPPSGRN